MDALELLRADHESVLAMLEELERHSSEPAHDGEDQRARRELVTDLVMAESAHEAIEEQYFWPSVQHWLDEGKKLASPALEQEQAAKSLLSELETCEPGTPAFDRLLSTVIKDAREHIAYEENQVWPVVRERLSPVALTDMGEKMARAKKLAPTRPHPHTPPNPGVLKSAGTVAAGMDKARDAVTGRGKHPST